MKGIIYFVIILITLLSFQMINAADQEDITPEEQQWLNEAKQKGASEEQIKELKFIFKVKRGENKVWSEEELDELDTLLKSKWNQMRKALDHGDIDTAASFFCMKSRDGYREMFSRLPQKKLSEVSRGLADICMIKVYGNHYAEYDIRRNVDGKTYSYMLIFLRNSDDKWEIKSF
ncbi:MAG: hypothetical protein JW743_09535 [Deltaproteobacteria bacterium]|nr:hypothetical protein [Deltaproteobacteria bacterium]MBN2844751.1 hypothetical protein [Deltaproteobacteria bacterium]